MRLVWRAAVLALATSSLWASTLYSNGPIAGGENGAWAIFPDTEVADSFTVSDNSIVTGIANIGLWVPTPNSPLTLNWVISSSAFGGTIEGSGSAVTLSSSFIGFGSAGYSNYGIYSASFTVSNLSLAAGTYYLNLFNATAGGSYPVYWDANGGASMAYLEQGPVQQALPLSDSFEIDGTVATPEPTDAPLCFAGMVTLGVLALRNKRR